MKKLGRKMHHFFGTAAGQVVGVGISIAAFLSLTLTRISSSSIWFDEGFSTLISRHSFGEIFHYTAVDVHPPVYYWLLKIWTSLFGTSDVAFRSMSVFFGVIALILVYLLVRQLLSKRAALFATFLVAVSPMFVRYGIEARMYMVVVVICLAATLMLLRAMRTNKRSDYIIYGILLSLGVWTHYFTVVVWLGHWVYRFVCIKRSQSSLHGKELALAFLSKDWIIAHALAITLYIPWIPFALKQMGGLAGGFWIPPVTLNTPGDYIADVLFRLEGGNADGWLFIIAMAIICFMVYMLRRIWQVAKKSEKRSLWLIIALTIAPVIFLMMLSLYPFKSVFINRYLLPSIVCLYILMAITICLYQKHGLRPVWISILTTILLLGSFTFGIVNVYRYGNYNRNADSSSKQTLTKEIIAKINDEDASSTPIIVNHPYSYFEAVNYTTDSHDVYYLGTQVYSEDMIKIGSLEMLRDDTSHAIFDINDFVSQHNQVWVIGNTDGKPVELDEADNWHEAKTISVTDAISGQPSYTATLWEK